ncbi:MAG: TolC family protein [Bdellovibrionales bacterium]|nr:TolC family protein [Bdellovibrionales bacterium]
MNIHAKMLLLGMGLSLGGAVQAAEPTCPTSYANAQDVFKCALANHPYLIRERSRLKQGEKLLDIASALPNPELEARIEHQDASGQSSVATDVTLLQPLELGGKRGARQLKAKADKMSLASEAVSVQEQVALQTITDLYRLRQLQEELERVQEALRTFDKVSRQYRERGRLTPEQQISLSVFRMAGSDYKIRESLLEAEIIERVRSLEFATGRKFEITAKLLPIYKTKWPEVIPAGDGKEGSEVLKAKAELTVAGAEVELADSDAWPDLRVGPAFSNSGEGANSQQTFGIMLSMPIPILNRNGGKKEHSRLGIEMAARNFEAVQSRVTKERANLVDRYRRAVDSLTRAGSGLNINQEHAKIESFMERGIVPSALVIESHRQLIDFMRSRHEQEIAALEALWKIYAIDGKIEEREI